MQFLNLIIDDLGHKLYGGNRHVEAKVTSRAGGSERAHEPSGRHIEPRGSKKLVFDSYFSKRGPNMYFFLQH
jgi:hypothetical protein